MPRCHPRNTWLQETPLAQGCGSHPAHPREWGAWSPVPGSLLTQPVRPQPPGPGRAPALRWAPSSLHPPSQLGLPHRLSLHLEATKGLGQLGALGQDTGAQGRPGPIPDTSELLGPHRGHTTRGRLAAWGLREIQRIEGSGPEGSPRETDGKPGPDWGVVRMTGAAGGGAPPRVPSCALSRLGC